MMNTGKPCIGCKIVGLLVGIGALNWGLVGIFHMNLVEKALGMSPAAKIVYGLIGLAGAIKLVSLVVPCPCCKPAGAGGSCSSHGKS